MSQHDMNVVNADGATVRADLNDALAALASLSSGATAPTTVFAYMLWADTANNLLKQRNAANSAWIARGPLAAAGVLAKTAAYTVALADFGKLIDGDASGGDFTLTLPAAASAGDGFSVAVKNTGSSGTVTLDGDSAETIDGATTLALAGQYDGVVLRCDGSAWHVVAEKIAVTATTLTLATPVNATSGTSIDFTSIPAGTKKITISFEGVSASGSSMIMTQIGDSGGIEATGYLGAAERPGTITNFTTGFGWTGASTSSDVRHGLMMLTLLDSATNTWAASAVTGLSDAANMGYGAGSKSLSAELDRLRITTLGGSDTFDAGKINIQYE